MEHRLTRKMMAISALVLAVLWLASLVVRAFLPVFILALIAVAVIFIFSVSQTSTKKGSPPRGRGAMPSLFSQPSSNKKPGNNKQQATPSNTQTILIIILGAAALIYLAFSS